LVSMGLTRAAPPALAGSQPLGQAGASKGPTAALFGSCAGGSAAAVWVLQATAYHALMLLGVPVGAMLLCVPALAT
jgi:hypothetical protein